MQNPFRYFNSSPEVIRLAVMMYIRYLLSLRQVEDLLLGRGIDICHETVRFCGASTASETANKPAINVLMYAAAMSVVTPEAEVNLKRRNFRF